MTTIKSVPARSDQGVFIGPVTAGVLYFLRAGGFYWDAYIPCSADGYAAPLSYLAGFPPAHKDGIRYMRLWGCIVPPQTEPAPNTTWFKLGSEAQFVPPANGDLWVVANDRPGFYGNNFGAVTVYLSDAPMPQVGANWWWSRLSAFLAKIHGTPAILGLQLLTAYFLIATQQSHDLMTATTDETDHSLAFNISLFLGASVLLSFQSWFWSRTIIVENFGQDPAKWRPFWLLNWGPRAIGMSPFITGVMAMVAAGVPAWCPMLQAFVGLVLLAAYSLRRRVFGWKHVPGQTTTPAQYAANKARAEFTGMAGGLIAAASVIGALVFMGVFAFCPVGPAQALGPAPVVYLAVSLIIPAIAGASSFLRVTRFPLVTCLLIAAVLVGPDDHQVGRRAYAVTANPAPTGALVSRRPSLDAALDRWVALQIAQHPAYAQPGAPIPIVMVAAAGGASRAGYWAALTLDALQSMETDGRFSDRVFAISSVSGGSVGAAGFVIESALDQTNPDPAQGLAARMNDGDSLSPALAGLLFPDLAQRFIPFPMFPDRAEGLERSWEARWRLIAPEHTDPNLVAEGYLELWKGRAINAKPDVGSGEHWTPLLLINGTREEDGRRVITAPIQIDPNIFFDSVDFFALSGRDVRVSTAIHNGARFPIISPAGVIVDPSGRHYGHILDGGYFNNAGTETLRDLTQAVVLYSQAHPQHPLAPILVEINNEDGAWNPSFDREGRLDPRAIQQMQQSATFSFANDILGPLMGSENVGGSHGTISSVVLARYGPQTTDALPHAYAFVHLYPLEAKSLPVDWVLSKQAMRRAQIVAGLRDPTPPVPRQPNTSCTDDPCSINRAVLQSIIHDISDPAHAQAAPPPSPSACCAYAPR